jgi:arylsulfatase A-like enzyme
MPRARRAFVPPTVLSALAAGLAGAALGGCSLLEPGELPKGDPGQPDIILVSIDTLRADHLGSYGHIRDTSPFMDSLAKSGVRFSFARSASPWTLPSHTTMLSGQLPMTHKVIEDSLQLDDAVPVLPERMQAAGYSTAAFVSTFYVSSQFGFDRGFDHFDDFDIHNPKVNLKGTVDMDDVVDATLRWWSGQKPGQPVFLFLHTYDVHYEYDPPGDYATLFDRAPNSSDTKYKNYKYFKKNLPDAAQLEHQRAQYDESIRYVDDQLKRIADAAKAAGRDVRFVITSDHGEEFGERGSWGHAHTLYAEQLHVPLIMSGGGLPEGVVVDGAVGTQDIAPTMVGWTEQDALQADGLDLAPALGGTPLPVRPFTAETTRFKTNRVGLYENGLRLEWDVKSNTAELFDPHTDPREEHDLASAKSAELRALQTRLLEVLGEPWEVRRDGKVRTGGVIFKDGRRWGNKAVVRPGDTFLVLPYDAPVKMVVDGETLGPWAGVGGASPDAEAPLAWKGTTAGGVEIDDEQAKMLEALGYMKGSDDDEEPAPEEDEADTTDGEAPPDGAAAPEAAAPEAAAPEAGAPPQGTPDSDRPKTPPAEAGDATP